MLFRKKIERSCSYCTKAAKIDDDTYLCAKKGPVSPCDKCRRFKYDPLKRVPARMKAKDFSKLDDMDFSL